MDYFATKHVKQSILKSGNSKITKLIEQLRTLMISYSTCMLQYVKKKRHQPKVKKFAAEDLLETNLGMN